MWTYRFDVRKAEEQLGVTNKKAFNACFGKNVKSLV